MTSITIALSEELMKQLQILAERNQMEPEALVQTTIEQLLSSSNETQSFDELVDYVLEKNKELYGRLAA